MKTFKKSTIVITLIVVMTSIFASGTKAETPTVQIYFDADLTVSSVNCPNAPMGTVATKIYFVAENFTDKISRIEYRLLYPNPILWISDDTTSGTTTGNTHDGIVHTWATPQDASGKLVLAEGLVLWMCEDCVGIENTIFCADSHPGTGYLRAAKSSDSTWIYPLSLGGQICGHSMDPVSCLVTSPVKSTSWGYIKSMYD